MSDQDQRKGAALFLPDGPITDNIVLLSWLDQIRDIAFTGAIALGAGAGATNASLRKVNPHLLVAGMSSRYRAHMVSKPIEQAGEALIVVGKYIVTAKNRFEAGYQNELEAAGFKPKASDFKFRSH